LQEYRLLKEGWMKTSTASNMHVQQLLRGIMKVCAVPGH
jgi:hypothetical protein